MVVDAQPTVRVTGKVAHRRVPVNAVVQQTCTQLAGMAEDDLRIRPPASQDGPGHNPVEVAVSDYPAYIQR